MKETQYKSLLNIMGLSPYNAENVLNHIDRNDETIGFIIGKCTNTSTLYATVFKHLDFSKTKEALKNNSLDLVLRDAWHQHNANNYIPLVGVLIEHNSEVPKNE